MQTFLFLVTAAMKNTNEKRNKIKRKMKPQYPNL
jgi:hypothetical protein